MDNILLTLNVLCVYIYDILYTTEMGIEFKLKNNYSFLLVCAGLRALIAYKYSTGIARLDINHYEMSSYPSED